MVGGRQAQRHAAAAVAVRQADVVVGVVGEPPALVAVGAAGLAGEQAEAPDLGVGEGRPVARDPAVEARDGGEQGALEGGERLGHGALARAGLVGEGVGEGRGVARVGGEPAGHVAQPLPHLVRVLDREADLRLERGRAPVPEQGPRPGEVEQRRRVARRRPAGHAEAARPRVGEGVRRVVAARAGDPAVARQRRVVEQPPPEPDLRGRVGVVGRERDGGRPGEAGLERAEVVRGRGLGRRRPERQQDQEGGDAPLNPGSRRHRSRPA